MIHLSNRYPTQAGFSLVEMAIVLAIVALLLGGLLPSVTSQIEQQRRNETRKQLADIQQALLGFAIMHGRLPCPTTEANPANAGYGEEAASCPIGTPANDGYLPWKTLGVAETDAWGSKRSSATSLWRGYWRYRTDRNFSNSGALITLTPVVTGFSADNIAIADNSGAILTSASERPIAVVYSTGADLEPDQQNVSYEDTNATYQSDVPSPAFDDILIWISRPVLLNRMVTAGKLP